MLPRFSSENDWGPMQAPLLGLCGVHLPPIGEAVATEKSPPLKPKEGLNGPPSLRAVYEMQKAHADAQAFAGEAVEFG
jgi:hypothetical protein